MSFPPNEFSFLLFKKDKTKQTEYYEDDQCNRHKYLPNYIKQLII